MSPWILTNLTAYSLEVGALVAVAACAPAALRMRDPKTRLWFWRLVLLACLILPAVRTWRIEASIGDVRVITGPMMVVGAEGVHARAPLPWTEICLAVIALGIGVRLVLLGVGLWRLSRYRRRAVESREAAFSGDVSIRISHEIEGPVTFGFFRPVILLPERFPHLDAHTRDAILHHEMLHVARFDWLETVVQELVRAALWFHPAIWWLLGEIQLTREQAVDREVIAATNAAEQYVDALLAIARTDVAIDLAPAFLRRRQLKQRVMSIIEEARMPNRRVSKTRTISTMALAASLVAGACWMVTGAFPLHAQSRAVADDAGVSVDLFGSAIQHRNSVLYPESARQNKIEGTVVAQVRLGSTGTVIDAQILSGPDELRNTVLQSVLGWHFSKDLAGSVRQVAVTFHAPLSSAPAGAITMPTAAGAVTFTASLHNGSPEISAEPPTVRSLNFINANLTPEQTSALPLHAGDRMTPDMFNKFRAAVAEIDEHYSVRVSIVPPNGVSLTVMPQQQLPTARMQYLQDQAAAGRSDSRGSQLAVPLVPPPPPPLPAGTSAAPQGPIVIGDRVQAAKLITHVDPVYPVIAKTARISGKVILEAVIGLDGHIDSLAVVSGHPMLQQAALQAVRQWVYQPTYLNNQPVAVQTTIEVNFTLSN